MENQNNNQNNQIQSESGHHRHISAKMIAFLLTAVFILAISSFWLVNRFVFRYEPIKDLQINSEIIKKNETLAKATAEVVKAQINKILLIGSFYSDKKDFIAFIEKGKWQDAINSTYGAFKEVPSESLDRIALFDMTGTTMANTPSGQGQLLGQNFAFRDWYRGVTTNFKPYVSEVYVRATDPKFNVVGVAFPVINNKGVPVAILLFTVKTDTFVRWLSEAKFGNSGLSFIVDQRGQVVAHPEIPPQGGIVDYSSRSDVQRVISGKSGTDIVLNSKNERAVVSFEPIPEFHWGVITIIKIEELEASGLVKVK